MAGETVTIENGPETEAAKTAAETANLAAQAAVATAANLGAQAASAAERAVTEISEATAAELAEQEEDIAWLREHTRLSAEHRESVNRELADLKAEQQSLKTSTAEILTGFQSLMKSLALQAPVTESLPTATNPPEIPPEGAAAPKAPETPARKRRLI